MRNALVILFLVILVPTASWAGERHDMDAAKSLSATDACKVVLQEFPNKSEVFLINGLYFSDGHHGAMFEVPGCSIFPALSKQAMEKIRNFRGEFEKKCNVTLMNEVIRGSFVGTFERKPRYFSRSDSTLMVNVFTIDDFETKDLSSGEIKCPR